MSEISLSHSSSKAVCGDEVQLQQILSTAVDLACDIGQLQKRRLPDVRHIETKSSITDLVTDVDRESEEGIVERLGLSRPDDSILAEEGTLRNGTSGVRWVVDPLDGTTNYVYGYPSFGVSIAVEIDGEPKVAAVYDSSTGHCYRAVSGFGAFCDDAPIHVREQTDLARSLVATGFSYDSAERERQGAELAVILGCVRDIRRSGSAALDLCQLASGHLDAYYELDNGPWDYAAGSIIAREAGAKVLSLPAAHGRGPAVVAASGPLMEALVCLLQKAGALV